MKSRLVGIIAKTDSAQVLQIARRTAELVRKYNQTPIFEQSLAKVIQEKPGVLLRNMRVNLVFTLGGDGTVLRTVKDLPNLHTPIIAVNLGRHGYLTEVDEPHLEESFEKWLKGDYTIEKQWLLSVFYEGRLVAKCLNESMLIPNPVERMLNLDVSQNGHRIIRARSDGFIIATPTGSTAHAFSAGGPVVDSSLDALSLALVAPLQPVKSIVVPASRKLRVKVTEPGPAAILVNDGRAEKTLEIGDAVDFKRSSENVHFVRFGEQFLVRSLHRLASEREN